MSDERTQDDEMTADRIRAASIESGNLVRVQVEQLPDSENKTDFLRIQADMEDFWRNRATSEFCHQWLMVALRLDS
jgi:hypothetical protein